MHDQRVLLIEKWEYTDIYRCRSSNEPHKPTIGEKISGTIEEIGKLLIFRLSSPCEGS
jgi:hypothetical protein